ncbi:MAG: DegV family protein [Clostridia bacterium]|nr:DegV family protein [Clostridia bacterium]
MSEYVIITDSSCDLPASMADEMELTVVPLTVTMEEKSNYNYLDWREMQPKVFYDKLRNGVMAKTAAPSIGAFETAAEEHLKNGTDVLFLCFSSGLSATYQSALSAVEDLVKKYPERKIIAVDTLCASLGEGLILHLAVKKKREGLSIEQLRDYVEEIRLSICHWYTVDDLHFLKRGGRVSATVEIIGSLLGVKPVMHMDDEGKLVNVEIARGRKGSIKKLKDKMAELAVDPASQTVFISHGDCEDEANILADMIKAQLGVKEVVVNMIGPVIGAHSGPGTIALFFVGSKR